MRYSSSPVKNPLLVGIIGAILAASAAHAEEAGKDSDDAPGKMSALEEIVVTAQRTTEELARRAQKEAPNLINLITTAEISRLPDVNTGEAVRRIPGISLETDTGEGRYVNIRGIDSDLNSTTFGGLRLPPTNTSSPTGAGRAVAFDSIPIGFIGAIAVTKSNLPEQDAEAIGGTIDITPKTAPADGKPFAEIRLGTGEELLRHTGITDFALTTGTRFGGHGGYDPFSVLFTASLYNDGRGIDDAEAGFFHEEANGVLPKAISALEERYYQYHRRRHGYGIDLGFAPDQDNKYFVRYYDSGYTEDKYRDRLVWHFYDPVGDGVPPASVTVDPKNPNGILSNVSNLTVSLQDHSETLTQRVAEIGGKNKIEDATLDYHVGYTFGGYHSPYDYNYGFTNTGVTAATYDNTSLPDFPRIAVASPAGYNYTNPANYTLNSVTNATIEIKDHEWGIGTNLAIPTHFTSRADEEIKVGLNARIREKVGNQNNFTMNIADPISLSSAAATTNTGYYNGNFNIGPLVDAGYMRSYLQQNTALFTTDPIANQLNSTDDKEKVYAAYGQYQFGFGALGIIAGARVEATRATYSAFKQDLTGATCPATAVCPVSTDRSYTNLFPTAQARYEFTPDLIGRLAISSTLARPGFQQVAATTTIDGNGNVTTGNPNLKPSTSTGFDVAIEHYLPHAGIASFGLFTKEIKDYIVTNAAPLGGQQTAGNLGVAKLFTFTNGSPAHVYGMEAAYLQRFRDILPGPFAGFGIATNVTLVSSNYSIPVLDANGNSTLSRNSMLPSTSKTTGNFEILYQNYGFDLSLGAYYTSKNIFSVGPTEATDNWTQDRFSLDFGSQYKVNDMLGTYFNLKNLTNTPLKFTDGPTGSGPSQRINQREYYGITLQAGITLKF